MRRIGFVLLIVMMLVGCSSEEPEAVQGGEDVGDLGVKDVSDHGDGDVNNSQVDGDTDVAVERDSGGDPAADNQADPPLTAHQYCESTAELYCDFYLRCGRMNASSKEECLEIFAETCEEKYEPHYAAQGDAGRLALSAEGIAICEAHLKDVACHEQAGDIDGPCRQMWVGLQERGEECGPGIESLVCGEGTKCKLDLSLCGECVRAREIGQSCVPGEFDCVDAASCISGTCVERGLPGKECSEDKPCAVGLTCTEGVCAMYYDFVAVGDACDQARRCPHNAYCDEGICKAQAGLDEPCTSNAACRAGFCDEVCKALKPTGEGCTSGSECVSQICAEGSCAPIGYCI